MEDRIRNVVIPHLIAELGKEGIGGLAEYERRLQDNARNADVLGDLLFEADVALMFRHHGFQVTIRERPDLQINLNDQVAYAEVKHFRKKEQDRIDERTMRQSKDLVLVGDTRPTEGCDVWDQVAGVAINKVDQYKENAPNILVVATDSDSVNGMILSTAVHIYDERAEGDPCLHRLNAFILMDNQWYEWDSKLSMERNVYFERTARVKSPMSEGLIHTLASIVRWSTPRNITCIRGFQRCLAVS